MDPRLLGDDTELCLAASSLVGKLELTHAQRELLKAVGREPRVADIVREARLPKGLAKQHLIKLLDLELIAFKTASAEIDVVNPGNSDTGGRSDSDTAATGGQAELLILPEEVEGDEEARGLALPPGDAGEGRLGRLQPRTQPLGTNTDGTQASKAPTRGKTVADDANGASPPPANGRRATQTPSTLPAGSPTASPLPGAARSPQVITPLAPVTLVSSVKLGDHDANDRSTMQAPPPGGLAATRHGESLGEPHRNGARTLAAPVPVQSFPVQRFPVQSSPWEVEHPRTLQGMVPRPPGLPRDVLSDDGVAQPAHLSDSANGARGGTETDASGTMVRAQSGDTERPGPTNRPAPRFSGFEALRPGTEASVLAAGAASGGDEPLQPLPRVTVPRPNEVEGTDPMAGQVIPLVRIVRSPMVTLRAAEPRPHDASPIRPTGIVNLQPTNAASARPKTGPGEQVAVREGTSGRDGQLIAGVAVRNVGEEGARRNDTPRSPTSDPPAAEAFERMPNPLPSTPDTASKKSGNTLEGMVAQSSHPPPADSGRTIEGMPAQGAQGTSRVSPPGAAKTSSTLESMPAPPPGARAPHVPTGLVPTGLGPSDDLKSTLRGGVAASDGKTNKRSGRPSVVVRSGAPPQGSQTLIDLQPTGPTGRTLAGVLAPTAAEIASARTAGNTKTGSTMPSWNAQGVREALEHKQHRTDSGEHSRNQDESLEHYQVLECLAKGGSGVVYRVQDPSAGQSQSLALKVLRQGQHREADVLTAFAREAELMDALSHPNLVHFVHFGHENDEPFLLMEYIEGLSMAELLHHPVPLPLDVGLIIIQDALEALDYVHNTRLPDVIPDGLVHCDVSPQNLLVGADGRTRLIDFGTSRAPGKAVSDANVRCKPRYSSPEVMAGEAVGPQADLFSMGAVLFQLLSKQPAFSADPRRRKKESLVPNPSLLNRRAPTPFDPICQRALDPDPEGRYSSARDMLEALDAAVETSGIELRRARISFWVRRVIQSRHGDVEFDMSELEELLDTRRGRHRELPSSTSNEVPSAPSSENTKDVKPHKGRSVPPPPVEPVDQATSDPPSSSLGAASRYSVAPPGEAYSLSFTARLWITGASIGATIAIILFAVLKPEVFDAWFGEAEQPSWEQQEASPRPTEKTRHELQQEQFEEGMRQLLLRKDPSANGASNGPQINPVNEPASATEAEKPQEEVDDAPPQRAKPRPRPVARKRPAPKPAPTPETTSPPKASNDLAEVPKATAPRPSQDIPKKPVTGAMPSPEVESGLSEADPPTDGSGAERSSPPIASPPPTPEAPTAPTAPRTEQRPRGSLKPGVPVAP